MGLIAETPPEAPPAATRPDEVPAPVDGLTLLDGNRSQQREAVKPFVRKRRTFRLEFDDEWADGFVARVRSVSLGTFLKLIKLAAALDIENVKDFSEEDAAALEQLFSAFADALVDWNLHDPPDVPGGPIVPIPTTLDGVLSQDPEEMLTVIGGWMEAIGGVAAPLGATSTSGAQSLEASIPTADVSSSPPS